MKAAGALLEAGRCLILPADTARSGVRILGAAVAIAGAYFLAARLGLGLLLAGSDVAVFWPASGIAAGILIVLGRGAVPALLIGVVVGTIAVGFVSDRSLLTSLFNGFWNAGEALLAAWLLERWFGRSFTFRDLPRIAGFLVAAGVATAAFAIAGAATLTLLHVVTTAPYWDVWREWFLSSWVGMVVVAPLVIGAAQMWRKPLPRKEWIEGVGVLGLTAIACSYTMTRTTGSWLSFAPSAFVFPLLLWLTASCQPAFGIAGAFVASLVIILATTFGIGRFGDAAVPIMQRVAGAQLAMMTVTLFTLVLSVLFAQRKGAEDRLAKERAMLARLHAVGTRLWLKRDLRQALDDILAGAIALLGADMGAIRILHTARGFLKIEAQRGFSQEYLNCFGEVLAEGSSPCCRAARSGERIVIEDVEADTLFAPFRPMARGAGYRALQSTPIVNREGRLLGTLATHFRSVHKPTDQDLRLLDLYVRQAAEIIERHKAEDALRESEERLRLAQRRTGVGIWDWNLGTGKLTWTPELEAIFGLEPGSVKCYADFRKRVHAEDIEAMEARRAAAVRRGETFRNEFRIIRPDGQVRWILSLGGAFYDEATGEPDRILGNNIDITDRKQAELALDERNAQLVLASKTAYVGCYVNDLERDVITVSDGYVAIHGLREGTTQTTLSQWRTRVHPDHLAKFDELKKRIFDNRRHDYKFDYQIIRADGEVRWIESHGFVSYHNDGQPQRVIGVNIDVTDRKLTEARLSDALAAGRVLAFEWDAATCRSQRSDNADYILGVVGDGHFLRQVHPDDRAEFKSNIRALCPESPSYVMIFRFVRVDGVQVWMEETAKGDFDASGSLLRIKGLTRDITERKQAELALAERNAQLSLAGRAGRVGHFAYDLQTGLIEGSEGYAAIHGLPEGTTRSTIDQWRASVHPDDLPQFEELRDRAFENRLRDYRFDYRIIRAYGKIRWIDSRRFISYDAEGQPRRIVGINIDITERKELEDHKNKLIAELDHRVKNVLAIVSTVASRTQETSGSTAEFVAALDGRIKSMAITHELLSSRHWQGIPLAELVRRELAPYATAGNTNIDGSDVVLSAEAGQTLAMVFHELATNAAKFGSLSVATGCVSVRWSLVRNGHAEGRLRIQWEESGGPQVTPPIRSGFGTSVVREMVTYELDGTVDYLLAPDGVVCMLEIPARWLSTADQERGRD